jgi:two-component system, sensor histidine kinase and response regulator
VKKILLIDDSEYILDGTSTLLGFEGYNVITANNAKRGIELATQEQPDLVICDVSMPEMDGFGVLKALRSQKDTEAIRFMFLTARADKSDMRQGMEYGADDYLIKPFTLDELLSAIDAQWKKSDLIARGFEEIKMNITYALPHEFRTALNQIIGSGTYLKNEAEQLEPALTKELANDVISSAKRLLKITENFLVYAQLESISADPNARKALMQNYRCDEAGAMIYDMITTKVATAERTDDLHLECDVEGVSVPMSTENLNKVIDELIDNAIKFSDVGTALIIDVSLSDSKLVVTISDKGRGMSQSQISGIAAYKQFDRMLHEQQGVGLGLIIVKRLVELHNGTITINSSEGQGTTVQIILPAMVME